MSLIPNEDIEAVRAATDIVSLAAETVVLKQRGQEFWGCCPFHDEKSPSFKVNPSTQLWHCFGCSTGGDVFKYIMMREQLEFPEAVRYLAERSHIELHEVTQKSKMGSKRSRLFEILACAETFYHRELMKSSNQNAQEARDYLSGRGFNMEIAKKYFLGYAPGHNKLSQYLSSQGFTQQEMVDANLAVRRSGALYDRFYERVMFPIHDEFSKPIAFGGRIITSGEPKYLNSQESSIFHKSKNLYALDLAKESMVLSSKAIVVEGYTDVIGLHEAGFTNVVATLGTALTEQHIKILSRFVKQIYLIFDGDQAGKNAAERGLKFVDATKADFYSALIPNNQDPLEYISNHSANEFENLLEKAQPLIKFIIDKRLGQFNLSILDERARALESGAEALAYLNKGILADEYTRYLADVLNADLELVKHSVYEHRNKQRNFKNIGYNKELSAKTQGQSNNKVKQRLPLSQDDAFALNAERELLALIASYPAQTQEYADEILQLEWFSELNFKIAEAMLACGKDASATELVVAAKSIHERADEVLSAGRLLSSSDIEPKQTLEFLLNDLELKALQRNLRKKKTQLKHPEAFDAQSYDDLFEEVAQLQKSVRELEKKMIQASKRD